MRGFSDDQIAAADANVFMATSPLKRSIETTVLMTKGMAYPVQVLPILREVSHSRADIGSPVSELMSKVLFETK